MNSVPAKWEVKRLGEICIDSQYGLNYPSNGGCYPVLGMKNLNGGRIEINNLAYVDLTLEDLQKYRLNPGDLIVNRTNSLDLVGKTALFDLKGDYVFASYLVRFVLDKSRADPQYINYFCNSHIGVSQMQKLATKGVSQANINPTELKKNFQIPLPPLTEQRKIADILSTWDEAITKIGRLITALQNRKRGLVQRLLTGEIRFPRFEEKWTEMELGQFLKPVVRKIEKPKDGYLRLGLRSHGKGTFTSTMDEAGSEAVAMAHLFKVKEGDLIVNITFAWEGAIAIVGKDGDGALVSHRFPTYAFNTKKVLPDYFRYVMLTKLFFYDLGLISPGGAGRNRVMSKKDFLKLKIKVPSIEEQKKIGGTLMAIDEYINTLSMKLELLQRQKKGLMQRLLTGQVRVKV